MTPRKKILSSVKWKYFLMIQPKKSNEFLCNYLLNQIRMTQAKTHLMHCECDLYLLNYTRMTQPRKQVMHCDCLLNHIRMTQPKKTSYALWYCLLNFIRMTPPKKHLMQCDCLVNYIRMIKPKKDIMHCDY